MAEVNVDNRNVDRLAKILGYDPAGSHGGATVLTAALKEIQEEQDKATLATTKELVYKAMELRKQMKNKANQVNAELKKFDKELGKLLNRIEAFSKGKSLADIEAGEKDENKTEE